MATVAFVPVRCGSKSIALKNIKSFNGRPLVFWVLDALEKSSQVDEVIVATDCDEIEKCVAGFNFSKSKIYRRSATNATDQASTEAVMLEYINTGSVKQDDIFILSQATSPLTRAEDFDNAIEQFKAEKADSLLTCCRLKRFIWNEQGQPINYDPALRPRRQDFKGTLVENGAFYISTVNRILQSKNRLSGKIAIYEMPEYTFTELDEPEDWVLAEAIMRKHFGITTLTKNIRLVLSDIDGVLTDAGMYYTENGDELKKFNTYDGMAFQLLKEKGIKTGLITSENRVLNKRRSEKMGVDFIFQGVKDKLSVVMELCAKEGFDLQQVVYIGDDINDENLLLNVGFAACPSNAVQKIKNIPGIHILKTKGGNGAIRELTDLILQH
jgi:YrbI family 3-deoxy-D-manno-octulosonate 8-phosphate phosphatase